MKKSMFMVGLMVLAALTSCCVMPQEFRRSPKGLAAALNEDGWKVTEIMSVDQYLDFVGTMEVEAAMSSPRWAGQLRFCILGRTITVQDMREDRKQTLVPGTPPALHLASGLTEFIKKSHGRDVLNATLLREVLCGSRVVRSDEWWKTWVAQPRPAIQRALAKLEARQ